MKLDFMWDFLFIYLFFFGHCNKDLCSANVVFWPVSAASQLRDAVFFCMYSTAVSECFYTPTLNITPRLA